jgi:hypothetical protein
MFCHVGFSLCFIECDHGQIVDAFPKPTDYATLIPGAINTTKQAGNLPDNEVFSRPEFGNVALSRIHGFGAGSAYPQGLRHNLFCVDRPSSTRCSIKAASGFQVQQGTRTMTKVTTLASRRAAPKATPTTSTSTSAADLVQLHAQACNGLHAALRLLTSPSTEADAATFTQALSRAMRATTALKQACTAMEGGAA